MIRNPPKQNSIGNYLGLYITQIEKTNSEREPRQGRFRHPPRRVEHDFVRPYRARRYRRIRLWALWGLGIEA